MKLITRRENLWSWFFATLFAVSFIAFGSLMVIWCTRPVQGAYTRPQAMILPDLIACGKFECTEYRSGDIEQFGRYSPAYYTRRWKQLCKGSGRYTAMREAYEQGRPDPCSGAKEWQP